MDVTDLTKRERKRQGRSAVRHSGYPLRRLFQPAGQRPAAGSNGSRAVNVYGGGYSPDPRDWTWVVWAQVFFGITIWGIVVAGFILLVVRGNKCCV